MVVLLLPNVRYDCCVCRVVKVEFLTSSVSECRSLASVGVAHFSNYKEARRILMLLHFRLLSVAGVVVYPQVLQYWKLLLSDIRQYVAHNICTPS